jgi:hypothetical protein
VSAGKYFPRYIGHNPTFLNATSAKEQLAGSILEALQPNPAKPEPRGQKSEVRSQTGIRAVIVSTMIVSHK